ncbi:MAG: hypothetical protein ACKOA0_16050, partial [Burkholderiaceae bacterium]
MATSITNTTNSATSVTAPSPNPSLLQMKTQLTVALLEIADTTNNEQLKEIIKDAKITDAAPKGFPTGVSWADAFRMVARRVEDNNPSTPGNLVLSEDMLNRNLLSGIKLKQLGVNDLARFPLGTSVSGAIDALYKDTRNGVLVSELAKSGIYDLTAFPNGTSAFEAFKLIEYPEKPGEVSTTVYQNYQTATSALKALGITTLVNFPRGTTALEARNILEPKAETMMNMLGIPKANYKDYFTDPDIDPLSALSVLAQLPNSITRIQPLDSTRLAALPASVLAAPELERGRELARQTAAARNLVAMGYESLAPFSAMGRFAGKTITPLDAFTTAKLKPAPLDLPKPTTTSTERVFQPTPSANKRSYGQPNPVTYSVFTPPANLRVKPNPPATNVTVVTAAQVIAFNRQFWGGR